MLLFHLLAFIKRGHWNRKNITYTYWNTFEHKVKFKFEETDVASRSGIFTFASYNEIRYESLLSVFTSYMEINLLLIYALTIDN